MSSGTLGVLSSDLEAPPMSESSVESDLLESLDVLSELGVEVGGGDLSVLTVLEVVPLVKEPGGEAVALWLLADLGDVVDHFVGHVSGPHGERDVGLLAQKHGEPSSDSSDLSDCERSEPVSGKVGVLDSNDMSECLSVFDVKRFALRLRACLPCCKPNRFYITEFLDFYTHARPGRGSPNSLSRRARVP